MSTITQNISAARSGENTWLWLIKILTGPLLLILLGIHLTVNHFIGAEHGLLNYADVIAYYRNPIIPIMEILFLAAVVTHSLSGLRGIVLDLKPSRTFLKILDVILVVFGVSVIIYGVWLITAIVAQG